MSSARASVIVTVLGLFMVASSASSVSAQELAGVPALTSDPVFQGDTFYMKGDYYRAITQYELFLMTSPPKDQADAVRLKIAWMYREAGKLNAAAAGLTRIIATRASHDRLTAWARLYYADVALEARQGGASLRAYQSLINECSGLVEAAKLAGAGAKGVGPGDCLYLESYARLGLARHYAKLHNFDEAVVQLRSLPEKSPIKVKAEETAAYVSGLTLPRKRPALAGALSIVPGLGHFYIEQYGIGVTAMVWNGAFIWALVDSITSRKFGQAALIGVVEFVWYSGTIFGAVAGAHRFNRDARRIVEEGMSRDLDRIDDQQSWPSRFELERPGLQLEWEWRF